VRTGCSKDGTQSIERAVALLRLLAGRAQTGYTLSGLAEAAGIKKTTAHRVLARLLHEGLVQRSGEGQRYRLGSFFPEVALGIPGYAAFLSASKQVADQLAAATACAAVVYLRAGTESVVVVCGGSSKGTGMLTGPGDRRPLLASSGGVAIAARLPVEEQAMVLSANLEALKSRGEARMTTIQEMLTRAREYGYAWSVGEFVSGVHAVAQVLPSSRPVASLSLIGPPARLQHGRLPQFAALLEERGQWLLTQTGAEAFPFSGGA